MNFGLVVLLLLLAGSGYVNMKLYDQHTLDQEKIEHNYGEVAKLERDLITARNQSQNQYEQEKNLIQSIDDQIKQKNADISKLEDQLRGFGNGEVAGNNPTTLEWDIRHQKEIVSDLEKQVSALKGQESEAGNISKLSQNQAKEQRADAERGLQAQIDSQIQNLRDLEGQLTQAKHDRLNKDAILNIQGQVNIQKSTINNLKTQKQNLKLEWTQSVNSTQGQSQAALTGLKQNERMLQDKILSEKNHLKDLEKNYDSTKHTVSKQLGQINDIQKKRDDIKNQIAKLQSDRQGHLKRLEALAPQ
jgi:chromosome segregation ATPase